MPATPRIGPLPVGCAPRRTLAGGGAGGGGSDGLPRCAERSSPDRQRPAARGRCPRETRRMAYDVELADRVRAVVGAEDGLTERRMFGGLAFLIRGNLAVSASGRGGLLLRVDPAETESLVSEPRVRHFEMRGREMDGWLHVQREVVEADGDLRRWV